MCMEVVSVSDTLLSCLQYVQRIWKRNMERLRLESECLVERNSWSSWGQGRGMRAEGSGEVK